MGSLGVHFALDAEVERRLLGAVGDDDAIMELIEEIEEGQATPHCDTDKAWEAIHRCLTDGQMAFDNGSYPLNACILGGRQLHEGEDYIVSYLTVGQVADVARALAPIDQAALAERYAAIDAEDYWNHGPEDLEYTWENFVDVVDFFRDCAAAGRAVIFTVDQ